MRKFLAEVWAELDFWIENTFGSVFFLLVLAVPLIWLILELT